MSLISSIPVSSAQQIQVLNKSEKQHAYWDIRTISEMVEEQIPVVGITTLIMGYLNIPYSKTSVKDYDEVISRPLTNVVWFEDYKREQESFKVEAVNPFSDAEMLRLKHLIRWENNQPDPHDKDHRKQAETRVVVFQPAKMVVNGEETPFTIRLMEKIAQNSPQYQTKFYSYTHHLLEVYDTPVATASCYSLSRIVIEATKFKPFVEQTQLVEDYGNQLPFAFHVIGAAFGWHNKTGEYMFGGPSMIYTWTQDQVKMNSGRMMVGNFMKGGLEVEKHVESEKPYIGIADLRILS